MSDGQSGLGAQYRLLLIGQGLSALGSGMGVVVVPTVALGATGEPAAAGGVVTLGLLARLLARLPAGTLVDRCHRQRAMVTAEAVRAATTALLAVALWADALLLVALCTCVVVEAVAGAVASSAETGALRRLVPPPDLPRALAVFAGRGYLATLLGPPLAAVLLAGGTWLPVAVDAGTFAVAAVSVALLRTDVGGRDRSGTWAGHVGEGLLHVLRDPVLRLVVSAGVGINLAFSGAVVLLVLMSAQQSGGRPGVASGAALSLAAGAGLAGAALSPLVLRRAGPGVVLVGSLALMCASLPLMALASGPLLAGAALGIGTAVGPTCGGLLSGYQARVTPDRLQGTVAAASGLLGSVGAPLGPVLAGWVLAAHGGQAAATALSCALVVCVVGSARPGVLRRLTAVLTGEVARGPEARGEREDLSTSPV